MGLSVGIVALPNVGKSTIFNALTAAGADRLLDLETFFTVGPKEARAWTLHRGAKAPHAAGEIHTDFERGFIRAETVSCTQLLECGSGRPRAPRARCAARVRITRCRTGM